jgi:hypothetical protein
MTDSSATEQQRILADLRELVAALDRRVPQPGRATESDIASDAAQLRDDAHALIRIIEQLIAAPAARVRQMRSYSMPSRHDPVIANVMPGCCTLTNIHSPSGL